MRRILGTVFVIVTCAGLAYACSSAARMPTLPPPEFEPPVLPPWDGGSAAGAASVTSDAGEDNTSATQPTLGSREMPPGIDPTPAPGTVDPLEDAGSRLPEPTFR